MSNDQPKPTPNPTPGPWKAEFYRVPIGDTGDYDNVAHIRGQGGQIVAFVEDYNAQEANAALIARAPELQKRVDELERALDQEGAAIGMLKVLQADNQRLRDLLRRIAEAASGDDLGSIGPVLLEEINAIGRTGE